MHLLVQETSPASHASMHLEMAACSEFTGYEADVVAFWALAVRAKRPVRMRGVKRIFVCFVLFRFVLDIQAKGFRYRISSSCYANSKSQQASVRASVCRRFAVRVSYLDGNKTTKSSEERKKERKGKWEGGRRGGGGYMLCHMNSSR